MKRFLFFLLTLVGFAIPSLAIEVDPCLPKKPENEDRLVFQFTPWLRPDEVEQLNSILVEFARESSNRIAIVIVDSLCGYNASDFAVDLGHAWGIGGAKMDNGVVVLVKPTGGPGDRKVFIATGYGLEGAIPDAICRRIVDNEIIPRFKNGDGYGGLHAGIGVLMKLARGEINAKSYGKNKVPVGALLIIGAVFLLIIISIVAVANRARKYARTNDIDLWSALWLLNQAGRTHRGSWGGFTGGGGGGWSGGGGGGGFGGFGGGGFGGGGAGGSW